MRKFYFLFFFIYLNWTSSYCQEDVYLKTGINLTKFRFLDKAGDPLYQFLPGISPSLEIGYGLQLTDFLVNEIGLSLDEYTSKGDNKSKDHSWSTLYGGLRNTTSFSVYLADQNIEISLFGVLGISSILVGDQRVNNGRYDLTQEEDFTGLFFQRGIGINLNFYLTDQVFVSSGIDRLINSKFKKSETESLSFSTSRILFGIHFIID
jgi:hypothetical protein